MRTNQGSNATGGRCYYLLVLLCLFLSLCVASSEAVKRGEGLWPSHVPFRLALVVVWMGNGGPPPSFQFFLSSVAANQNLVDLLLFHERNKHLQAAVDQLHPANAQVVDLGERGLTDHIALKLGQALNYNDSIIEELQKHMAFVYGTDPKTILELRPSFGTVFEEYLQGYTHWAYLDVDQILGDLPAWMSLDEFMDYDLVTYCAGDNNKIYVRGPLTMFNLSSPLKPSLIWKSTPYMGMHLREYMEFKDNTCLRQIDKHMEFQGLFPFGCKMTPDESVFSLAVTSVPKIKVKFSNKNRADPNSNAAIPKPWQYQIYYVNGAIRFCVPDNFLRRLKRLNMRLDQLDAVPCDVLSNSRFRFHMAESSGSTDKQELPSMPLKVDPAFPGMQKVVRETAVKRPVPSYRQGCETNWIGQFGRCFLNISRFVNVLYRDGQWYYQNFVLPVEKREECMVMHFRVWKRKWDKVPAHKWPHPPPEGGGQYLITQRGIFSLEPFL